MKFSEIKQQLAKADNSAVQDWNDQLSDCCPPHLEEVLRFVEYRRSLLTTAVVMILNELIERQDAPLPNASEDPSE